MTVKRKKTGAIELSGRCGAEDAEALQRFLLARRDAAVQWTHCEYLHAAVLQVLLVARARMRGTPEDAFLGAHLAPILHKAAAGAGNDGVGHN